MLRERTQKNTVFICRQVKQKRLFEGLEHKSLPIDKTSEAETSREQLCHMEAQKQALKN